jgi:hypothetical protein
MIRKIAIPALFCLVGVLFDSSSSEAHSAKTVVHKVGLMRKSFMPPEPYNWRGPKTHALITDIWYPADTSSVE